MKTIILSLAMILTAAPALAAEFKLDFSDLSVDTANSKQQTLDLEAKFKSQYSNIQYKSLNVSQVVATVKSGVGGATVFMLQGDEVMGSRAINSDPARFGDSAENSFEQAAMKTLGFKAGTKLQLVLRGKMILRSVTLLIDGEAIANPQPTQPAQPARPQPTQPTQPPAQPKPAPQPPPPPAPAQSFRAPQFHVRDEVVVDGGYWAKIQKINSTQQIVEVVYLAFPGLHAYRFDQVYLTNGCVQMICVGDTVQASRIKAKVVAVNPDNGVWIQPNSSEDILLYAPKNLRVIKRKN